jgi:hypothetical protein
MDRDSIKAILVNNAYRGWFDQGDRHIPGNFKDLLGKVVWQLINDLEAGYMAIEEAKSFAYRFGLKEHQVCYFMDMN